MAASYSIKRDNPELYRMICDGLKEGKTVRQIASAHGVGEGTVCKIRFDIQKDLPSFKAATAARWAQFIEKAQERIVSEVGTMSVDKLPVAAAIAQDKLALLAGEATQISRVEHVELPNVNELIDALPSVKVLQTPDTDLQLVVSTEQSSGLENRGPHHSTVQVRNDKGKFTKAPRGEGVDATPDGANGDE